MKKFLLFALLALLGVGGSMFAYTYTTATTTIAISAPASDFATVTTGNITAVPTVFGKYTGTWPSNTLFNIAPNASYPGDLVIRVSLVNAGALIRAYEHSNMTLQFVDSASQTVDEQRGFQVLNLDNAEVEFTWANGTGTAPYRVMLTGGSFRLHPWKSLSGGSVQPQLWCEILQR